MSIAMPSRRVLQIIGAVGVSGLVFAAGRWSGPSEATGVLSIDYPAPNVTTIQVPVGPLTTEVVDGYLDSVYGNPVDDLFTENEELKVLVEELSLSLATVTSEGRGEVAITPIETPPSELPFEPSDIPAPVWPPAFWPPLEAPPPFPSRVEFNDFRLNFLAEGTEAEYTLSQKFLILNTAGRDENNVPTNLIRLFELGPGETRTPIPVTETTTVAAVGTPPHWYVKIGLQGGMGPVMGTTGGGSSLTAFIGIPWLKRGTNRSTENTRWALLTPVVQIPQSRLYSAGFGVLPFSVNLGTIMSDKHPLTNMWISPYMGTTTGTTINRVGGILSVTF